MAPVPHNVLQVSKYQTRGGSKRYYEAMVTRFVRSQLRKFKKCTANAHKITSDELKQKVKKIHESLLQFSVSKEIEKHIDLLMQDLKDSAKLVFKEQEHVSKLVERHEADNIIGCHSDPFIKIYGPIITNLENMCKKHDKTLKGLETGLLIYFNKDPLLGEVQSLLNRNRALSKMGSESFNQFYRYNSRVKTELSWISDFPKSLKLCSEQFLSIMSQIMSLKGALSEKRQMIYDLVSSKEDSRDFKSHFSDLHKLKRTLDAIELMSEGSSAVMQAISDVSSQCKVLASIYEEKKIISLRFATYEQLAKKNVPKLEGSINELHLEVNNADNLYAEKFSCLSKDALVPEININVYEKAKDNSDFSWRTRKFNNRIIVPLIKTQGRGQCAYVATTSCTESLYKKLSAALTIVEGETYQADEFTLKLSHEHLQDLVTAFRETNTRKGYNPLDYCLERMEAQGVLTEEAYDHSVDNNDSLQRYRIKEFEKLNTANIEEATAIIKEGTALIANVKITTDYYRLGGNDIYDIPKGAVFETNLTGQAVSHCVVVIGFGVTPEGRSYYVFQNSYGPSWGVDGYGRVFCSCLKYLYRAKV